MHPKLEDYQKRKAKLMELGGLDKIEKQHAKGKLTCRERLELLFDEGTFEEIGLFVTSRSYELGMDKNYTPADGVVTGFGRVNGRKVYAYANDFTVMAATSAEMNSLKITRLMEEAIAVGCPIVALVESGGGRLQEHSNGGNHLFNASVRASGAVPQITAIMGPCTGVGTYNSALSDFVYMVRGTSKMYVTGIKVIKQVNGEAVDENYFGTPEYNSELSGCCHKVVENDQQCIEEIKKLLSYLPQNFREKPPVYPCDADNNKLIDELNYILPERMKAGYDVLDLISLIVDKDSIYEVQPDFAKNVVCALTRLNGKTLGVIANQPMYLGGCIDINASDKMSHFITFCDAYNIPMLWLADCPGYLPGNDQESGGIIRHGAKALYAFCSSTVPKVRIATRKYYGGSKGAYGDRAMGVDYAIAWPTCEESTMGGEGASQIIFAKELKAAKEQGDEAYQAKLAECAERFNAAMDSPYFWAKNLWTDMIIMPDETRRVLVHIYETLETKKAALPEKKHGIFPV